MNFLSKQEEIKDYIETFNDLLEETSLDKVEIVDDFVDLDKYKAKNTLFINFNDFYFDGLSNESDNCNITITFYIVCRNDTPENLKTKVMSYSTLLYGFIYNDRCLNGAVDYGTIGNVHIYEAAEGASNIKVAELKLNLQVEDDEITLDL